MHHYLDFENNKLRLTGEMHPNDCWDEETERDAIISIDVKMTFGTYLDLKQGGFERSQLGWITLQQARSLTGYSAGYLYTLTGLGRIKSQKKGNALQLNRADLLYYYNSKQKAVKRGLQVNDQIQKLGRAIGESGPVRITRVH